MQSRSSIPDGEDNSVDRFFDFKRKSAQTLARDCLLPFFSQTLPEIRPVYQKKHAQKTSKTGKSNPCQHWSLNTVARNNPEIRQIFNFENS
ncbi:MAG: hypothetical protein AB2693_23620 [Candidatus Thiodiazotropha sp.]